MKAIGGYFELELNVGTEYYQNAIRLNTGRNALEYILASKSYKKIYIPYFTCDVLLQPIKKLGIEYAFYHMNSQLEPVFDFDKIQSNEVFLYTNYFGQKDEFILELSKKNRNIIIDNAQSFYSRPLEGIDTFYSPRKFFGIPDGAYLFTNKKLNKKLEKDISYTRFEHLTKRIDVSPEEGYSAFSKNDAALDNQPILEMSNLTLRLLQSINYDEIAQQRKSNYKFLESALQSCNQFKLKINDSQIAMVYPFWTKEKGLRKKLMEKRIYTATYWPNVSEWTNKNMLEYNLMEEVVYLPIDQRYNQSDLQKVVNFILTD